jgi:predicted Zn-dependent peptidase
MMFKGSENVGAGEHFYLIFTKGGSMNGTTNNDRTLYYEVMPKNQLDLGLFLEADRMRSLKISKENLDNQRQAVKEERRLGVDNQPYGQSYEKLEELAYDNFAYKHTVIGSMADLDAASVEDVSQFFKTYYAPNNAVLALVGDLDPKDTLAKVKKYFGSIPRQEAPKPVDLTEPEKNGERRAKIDDKLARLTQLTIAYRVPPITNPETRALSVGSTILGGGESSRLYQKLVKEKEVVSSIFCSVDGRAGPSKLQIQAMIRPGKTAQEVEGLISEEIARFISSPVAEKELDRTRAGILRGAVAPRESVLSTAISLADSAALYNDPNRVNTEFEKRRAVTADEIQKAAQKYLRTANRVVVVTEPAAAGAPRAVPQQKN